MKKVVKGVGLVSGGLDSFLAVALVKSQGVEVICVNYEIGFSQDTLEAIVVEGISAAEQVDRRASKLSHLMGVPVRGIDLSGEYMDVLFRPKHGYGANVNPCLDCRIFMLKKSGEIMREQNADFIFTGEVLGQRPMSQRRDAMNLVERESGLKGLLLRPLCAKLMKPTIPEERGWINRERMLEIAGRSRKRQLELVDQLGIEGFKQPSGGCMLTDQNYARRLDDLFSYKDYDSVNYSDMVMMSVGRHLRLRENVKIVVGRNESENFYLSKNSSGYWTFRTVDIPGPVVLLIGDPNENDLERSASVTARYSDGKHLPRVGIVAKKDDICRSFSIKPSDDEEIREMHI